MVQERGTDPLALWERCSLTVPCLIMLIFYFSKQQNFMRFTPIDVCSLTIWCTVTEVAKYDYCLGSKEKTEIL